MVVFVRGDKNQMKNICCNTLSNKVTQLHQNVHKVRSASPYKHYGHFDASHIESIAISLHYTGRKNGFAQIYQ